ncbi:DNA helicase (nucleomorph) [Lotharella oceanica]|uniref:DNA helicase n=1 Tax=Lotharella oceanica TaxID=641309 RepID=A0A060DBH5_9EUKA|nr:DNA helicase [Lotharella oceanica]
MIEFYLNKKKEIYSKMLLILINILRKGNFLRTSLMIFCRKGEGKINIMKYFFINVIKWIPVSKILYGYFFGSDNVEAYFHKNIRASIGVKKKIYDEKITGFVIELGIAKNKYYIILKNKFIESYFFLSQKLLLKINKLKIRRGDLITINKNLGKISKLKINNYIELEKELIKKSFYYKILNFKDLDYFNLFAHGVIGDNHNTKIMISKIIARQVDIKILTWYLHGDAFLCIGFTIIDDFNIMLSGKINPIMNIPNLLIYPNIIIFSNLPMRLLVKKFNNKEYFFFSKYIKNFIILKKKKNFYKLIKNKIKNSIFSLAFLLLLFIVKNSINKLHCYKIILYGEELNHIIDRNMIRNYVNYINDDKKVRIYLNHWYKKINRNIISIIKS